MRTLTSLCMAIAISFACIANNSVRNSFSLDIARKIACDPAFLQLLDDGFNISHHLRTDDAKLAFSKLLSKQRLNVNELTLLGFNEANSAEDCIKRIHLNIAKLKVSYPILTDKNYSELITNEAYKISITERKPEFLKKRTDDCAYQYFLIQPFAIHSGGFGQKLWMKTQPWRFGYPV